MLVLHLSQESWSSLSCEAAASRVRSPGRRKSTRPRPSLQATPILTMRTKGRTSRLTIACNTSILCRGVWGVFQKSHLLPAALPNTHWHNLQLPCTLPAASQLLVCSFPKSREDTPLSAWPPYNSCSRSPCCHCSYRSLGEIY